MRDERRGRSCEMSEDETTRALLSPRDLDSYNKCLDGPGSYRWIKHVFIA